VRAAVDLGAALAEEMLGGGVQVTNHPVAVEENERVRRAGENLLGSERREGAPKRGRPVLLLG
jgi:hypothetical protein